MMDGRGRMIEGGGGIPRLIVPRLVPHSPCMMDDHEHPGPGVFRIEFLRFEIRSIRLLLEVDMMVPDPIPHRVSAPRRFAVGCHTPIELGPRGRRHASAGVHPAYLRDFMRFQRRCAVPAAPHLPGVRLVVIIRTIQPAERSRAGSDICEGIQMLARSGDLVFDGQVEPPEVRPLGDHCSGDDLTASPEISR